VRRGLNVCIMRHRPTNTERFWPQCTLSYSQRLEIEQCTARICRLAVLHVAESRKDTSDVQLLFPFLPKKPRAGHHSTPPRDPSRGSRKMVHPSHLIIHSGCLKDLSKHVTGWGSSDEGLS